MMILLATGVSIAKLYKNKHKDKNYVLHYIIIGKFCLYLFLIILNIIGIMMDKIVLAIINATLLMVSLLIFF
ncbi:hypothetical protein FDF74_03865 [Clostridium niameyense]|uniref:Uncharacterized protein n=1 Tax=Clostridium niameyense TaxID=1622073 RepID=A0A6M0RAU8_9CLOT|nr:hypothetical protein [Clostridium niameyense]NEZ46348.1 hypothetical protein [Clostridium niameyense]